MADGPTVTHRLSRPDGTLTIIVLDKRDNQRNPPSAAIFGQPSDDCLVRVHSRCVYGEVFGSNDCDCRTQLDRSIELIRGEGAGVLIYLDQEGRGAGLLAKAQGYVISQEQHIDTFASYQHLGLAADTRTYDDAAALLRQLNLTRIRLLTNNLDKVRSLKEAGLTVKRESLLDDIPGEQALNYLIAKEQHGHLFR
jgi:GTP cyclohydrolase II